MAGRVELMTQHEIIAILRHTGDFASYTVDGQRVATNGHVIMSIDFDPGVENTGWVKDKPADVCQFWRAWVAEASRRNSGSGEVARPITTDSRSAVLLVADDQDRDRGPWLKINGRDQYLQVAYRLLFKGCHLIPLGIGHIFAVNGEGQLVGVVSPSWPAVIVGEPIPIPALDEIWQYISSEKNNWYGIPPANVVTRKIDALQAEIEAETQEVLASCTAASRLRADVRRSRSRIAALKAQIENLKGENLK